MPRWTVIRRSLARAPDSTGGDRSQLAATSTVPLALRGRTADGADLRVLVDAQVSPVSVDDERQLERITQALVVPAVRRWLAEHDLTGLPDELLSGRGELEDLVQPEFEALGARLLRLDVVAVEHLLASPSAEPEGGGTP